MTSILKVDNIQDSSGTGTPYITGAVLQMPFTQYTSTTTQAISANTNTVVPELTVNITPKSTSSIIKLDAHIFFEWQNSAASFNSVWFFYRDTTKLAIAQSGNRLCGISATSISENSDGASTPETAKYSYFDTPNTTSQITYKVGVITHYTTNFGINRCYADTDSTEYERGISFISATEIGG